jgi:hypothetical protein
MPDKFDRTVDALLADVDKAKQDEREEKIAERIAERTAYFEDSIKGCYARIQSLREDIGKLPGWVREAYAVFFDLEEAGFEPRMGSYSESIYLTATKDKLTALAKVLGPMPVSSKSVVVREVNGKERVLAQVDLTPTKFPNVTVSYETKVTKDMKCKVVTRVDRRRELVCEV